VEDMQGSSKFTVFFIDYGNTQDYSDLSKVRHLEERFVDIQMMAVKCSLSGNI
jgi:hypothetical protein